MKFYVKQEALEILGRVRMIDYYVCLADDRLAALGWRVDNKATVNFDVHGGGLYMNGQALSRNFQETLALVSNQARVEELGLRPSEEQRQKLRAQHRNRQRSRARARKRAANVEWQVNNRPEDVPAAALEPAFVAREPAAGAAVDPMDVIRDMLGARSRAR